MIQNLQIIIKERKHRRKRSSVPINFFWEKYSDSCDLLEKINKKIKTKHLNQEARKQHIISLVTAFEVYTKVTFIRLIDKQKLDHSHLINKDYKFDFDDVQLILKYKFTTGELIANRFNFQNLRDIEKAFSTLLNIDFFKSIKNYKFYYGKGKEEFIKIETDFYAKLEKLLNLRHEFTHDINFKDFIHMKDVNSLSENLFFFVHMMEFFIDERLEKVDYIKSITVAKDKN